MSNQSSSRGMTLEKFKIEVLPIKDKLFRFANRILRNIPESEDVVQEVLIRLWGKRDSLASLKSVEAFAIVMTKNLCLDRLKLKNNKTVEFIENNDTVYTKNPEKAMELSDSYRQIKRLIDLLPDQQRMIIHLRDIEGYDYNEIAEMLNINENTIRVNLSRARKKIREQMLKMYNYEFTKN